MNHLDPRPCGLCRFTVHDPIEKVSFTGWGGTCLEPVFEHYDKAPPTVLIIFSDLYCREIPKEDMPTYPVLWVCTDNKNATVNFGTLIHFDTSK